MKPEDFYKNEPEVTVEVRIVGRCEQDVRAAAEAMGVAIRGSAIVRRRSDGDVTVYGTKTIPAHKPTVVTVLDEPLDATKLTTMMIEQMTAGISLLRCVEHQIKADLLVRQTKRRQRQDCWEAHTDMLQSLWSCGEDGLEIMSSILSVIMDFSDGQLAVLRTGSVPMDQVGSKMMPVAGAINALSQQIYIIKDETARQSVCRAIGRSFVKEDVERLLNACQDAMDSDCRCPK